MQALDFILYTGFSAIHLFITFLFFISFARVIFAKYTPYSGFYVASIFCVQAIYNGCPFTEMQNWLGLRAGNLADPNEFMFGAFGDFTTIPRIIFFMLSVVIFRYSYNVWTKPTVVVNFNRCFKRFA